MKVLKKMISILVVLVLCTSHMSFSSQAAIASGTCGDNLTWMLDNAGTLTISGTGEMKDYFGVNPPWYAYNTSITNVIIEDNVVSVGAYAFQGCSSLHDIIISDEVSSIGIGAFYNCSSLSSVIIPDGVTSIETNAFYGCSNLSSVMLPNSVISIEDSAFYGCSNLSSVMLPNSVTSIGGWAFCGCSSLGSVTIPSSVTDISYSAFNGCDTLSGIWVDENNEYYSSDARGVLFSKEKNVLHYVPNAINGTYTVPDSVTSIKYNAFYDCSSLSNVVIPEGVTSIGNFNGCDSLNGIWVDENNLYYSSDEKGALFNKEKTELLRIPSTISGNYIISADVISIETDAFNGCCNLNGIWVDENNLYYSSDDRGVLFNKDKTELLRAPEAFSGSYNVPEEVTSIRDEAFSGCKALIRVTIPESMTQVGAYAFWDCTNLKDIVFYGDIPTINYSAFGMLKEKMGGDYDYMHDVIAMAYYPADNETWTSDVLQNYGGDLTWIPYDEILEGADNIWDSNNSEDLIVRVEKDFSELESVSVDGQTVDPANYDISEEGVTFHSDYLETLAAGERIVIIQFTDGVAITTLTIQPSTGDVNGDGEVNNKDLTRLFQYLSDWDVTVNEKAMDVNGDGSINNKDLTRLFQYLSNWDVEIH